MIDKFLAPASFLSIAMLISSCGGGITSHSYKAKDADLKKYKTVAWIKPSDPQEAARQDAKLYGELIVKLSIQELEKKGFVIDTNQPDAVFMFDSGVQDKVSYSQTPQVSVGVGFGGPYYYGGVYAPVAGGDIVQHQYQQGMLVIEMYDTKTQKLLWRGWAEEKITAQNDVEADVRTAVKHIFMRLPVKHK
jgi:hypothetical protein